MYRVYEEDWSRLWFENYKKFALMTNQDLRFISMMESIINIPNTANIVDGIFEDIKVFDINSDCIGCFWDDNFPSIKIDTQSASAHDIELLRVIDKKLDFHDLYPMVRWRYPGGKKGIIYCKPSLWNTLTINTAKSIPFITHPDRYILEHSVTVNLKEVLNNSALSLSLFSGNPLVTWTTVKENPHLKWSYCALARNPNITVKIVKENRHLPWDILNLCINPSTTWSDVLNNPDIPWEYEWLGANGNITMDIIDANPDKEWLYGMISENPSISWDYIFKNIDKQWVIDKLKYNPMTLEKQKYIRNRFRADFMKEDGIAEELLSVVLHPDNISKLCAEFTSLNHFN